MIDKRPVFKNKRNDEMAEISAEIFYGNKPDKGGRSFDRRRSDKRA